VRAGARVDTCLTHRSGSQRPRPGTKLARNGGCQHAGGPLAAHWPDHRSFRPGAAAPETRARAWLEGRRHGRRHRARRLRCGAASRDDGSAWPCARPQILADRGGRVPQATNQPRIRRMWRRDSRPFRTRRTMLRQRAIPRFRARGSAARGSGSQVTGQRRLERGRGGGGPRSAIRGRSPRTFLALESTLGANTTTGERRHLRGQRGAVRWCRSRRRPSDIRSARPLAFGSIGSTGPLARRRSVTATPLGRVRATPGSAPAARNCSQ
jgi:hypothetical protein